MLCSISTGRSNPSWLDRLRSSRGFPTSSDPDIDHFLTPHNPNSSNPTNPKLGSSSSQPKTGLDGTGGEEISGENGEENWFGIMGHVLAKLFIMGESNQNPNVCSKKSSRKQANPRNFAAHSKSSSIDSHQGVFATAPSRSDSSLAERNGGNGADCANDAAAADDDDEKCYGDLKEFSRTEVTVIDTSCGSWKFEKWLFRRKNVWKVRDKKCRWRNVGRKKRGVSSCDDGVGRGKKPKVAMLPLGLLKDSQEGGQSQQDGSSRSTDGFNQASKRRFPFSRIPRELRDGGSPLIHVEDGPTGQKIGSFIPPRSCIK